MRWVLGTSSKSEWIIPAQEYLFQKYHPEAELYYISNFDFSIDEWCYNMAEQLKVLDDVYIVFGLDDYLPIAPWSGPYPAVPDGVDRIGLGYGDSKTKEITEETGLFIKYAFNAPYQVTCQFSVWRRESLIRVLEEVNGSPWDFEVLGRCEAWALKEPRFRWIEEGALSRKWPGVNVLGLKPKDVIDLSDKKLINIHSTVFYLGQGRYSPSFRREFAGEKYGFNYDLV